MAKKVGSKKSPSPQPWERQPDETARAYEAFCIYRDLPPSERSIKRACQIFHGDAFKASKNAIWSEWSRKHNWVERANAWLDEQDRVTREAELDALREMRRRHIQTAQHLVRLGAAQLTKLAKELEEEAGEKLSPAMILKFLKEGALLERLARGEPDSIVRQLLDGKGEDALTFKVVFGKRGADDHDSDAGTASGPVEGSAE